MPDSLLPKLLHVIGTRPQVIKLAPLYDALQDAFHQDVLDTGQHYDVALSAQLYVDLQIPEPTYALGVGSGSHTRQTAKMLTGIAAVLEDLRPDVVLVYGDTNSTLAGALACAQLQIPVVHVEAGLRSFNRIMPEERNRVVVDHLCDVLFAPTETAMAQLAREGLAERARLTGDIMVDALSRGRQIVEKTPFNWSKSAWAKHPEDGFTLLTLHRPYNVDDPERLQTILERLAETGWTYLFPVHPRTRNVIEQHHIVVPETIRMLPPVGYLASVRLQMAAERIITDSGGIQKEAYILGKPCITLRPETEWVETVQAGWNLLCDPMARNFIPDIVRFAPVATRPPWFGTHVATNMKTQLRALVAEENTHG